MEREMDGSGDTLGLLVLSFLGRWEGGKKVGR